MLLRNSSLDRVNEHKKRYEKYSNVALMMLYRERDLVGIDRMAIKLLLKERGCQEVDDNLLG